MHTLSKFIAGFIIFVSLFSFASAIDVTNCMALNAPGEYTLANDINANLLEPVCFPITAPNVTLDCSNHYVQTSGDGQIAISTSAVFTTIENCLVVSSGAEGRGVVLKGATGANIHINAIERTPNPFSIQNTENSIIGNIVFNSNGKGIDVIDSNNNHFSQLMFYDTPYAMNMYGSANNVIEDVYIDTCRRSLACILLQDSTNNSFNQLQLEGAARTFFSSNADGADNVIDASEFITVDAIYLDFDDGSGMGVPDGVVNESDKEFFLLAYQNGDMSADVDDGTSTATPDGSLDVNDLLFFFRHYGSTADSIDVEVQGTDNLLRVRSTHYSGAEQVDHNSILERWWNYEALVQGDVNGSLVPLSFAGVRLTDGVGFDQLYMTNVNGSTLSHLIRGYMTTQSATAIDVYTVNGTKFGYLPYEQTGKILTDNTFDSIILATDDFNATTTANQTLVSAEEELLAAKRSRDGSCLTGWSCSAWSVCSNGIQSRNCDPSQSACYANPRLKPLESQNCIDPLVNPVAVVNAPQFQGIITGAVIGAQGVLDAGMLIAVLLLFVILALYVLMNRARSREQKKIAKGLKVLEWILLGVILLLILVALFA